MSSPFKGSNPDYETIGREIINVIDRYGFGVLPKSEWDGEILRILIESINQLRNEDSFGRAEMLGITDQRYRNLIKKIGMRHGHYADRRDDVSLIAQYVQQALVRFTETPGLEEVRIVENDEMKRRSLQRAIERANLPVDLSVTGHAVSMHKNDLDSLVARIPLDQLPQELKQATEKRKRDERITAIVSALQHTGTEVVTGIFTQLLVGA